MFNSSHFTVSVNENHFSKHGMVYRFYRKKWFPLKIIVETIIILRILEMILWYNFYSDKSLLCINTLSLIFYRYLFRILKEPPSLILGMMALVLSKSERMVSGVTIPTWLFQHFIFDFTKLLFNFPTLFPFISEYLCVLQHPWYCLLRINSFNILFKRGIITNEIK